MTENTYNGWTNYQTWCVNLWLDNEPSTYYGIREAIRPTWQAQEIADYLREFVEAAAPELQGMYSDLLTNALGHVNYYEIAEHLAEELQEE